jgi:hypothetical protein
MRRTVLTRLVTKVRGQATGVQTSLKRRFASTDFSGRPRSGNQLAHSLNLNHLATAELVDNSVDMLATPPDTQNNTRPKFMVRNRHAFDPCVSPQNFHQKIHI